MIRKNIKTKRLNDKLNHKKLGLYKIKKIKGPINYKLNLLSNINIYPVFHISFLELILPGAPRAPRVKIELINSNAKYKIKEIFDY